MHVCASGRLHHSGDAFAELAQQETDTGLTARRVPKTKLAFGAVSVGDGRSYDGKQRE